jgi:hypothetical protein
MKKITHIALTSIFATLLMLSGCKDDAPLVKHEGKMELVFTHFIGNIGMRLFEPDDDNFQYITREGERFNVLKLGYHLTKITLSGPNGEFYEDEVLITANEARGVYRVDHSDGASRLITLVNIPEGEYDQLSLTFGIEADMVQEGMQGGILDPENGAWFRNWDAGYMMMRFEGRSPSSPQIATAKYPVNGMHLHMTGWKDIPANPMMVNNVKRFSFPLPQSLKVGKDWLPNVHFALDVLKVLEDADHPIDFSVSYDMHDPNVVKPFADRLEKAFVIDHVHQ